MENNSIKRVYYECIRLYIGLQKTDKKYFFSQLCVTPKATIIFSPNLHNILPKRCFYE